MVLINGIFYSANKVNLDVRIGEYYKNTNEVNIDGKTNEINSFSYNGEKVLYNKENYIEDIEVIDKSIWEIEIPKINLKANIYEGTAKEILDEFVGHFENTQKEFGNIGLAAHNRGYNVNYFQNIKNLEIGDEIIYTYNGVKRIYIINLKTTIKETDWKYLENTEDNRITLITCVENEPEYRRCIQGVEKVYR